MKTTKKSIYINIPYITNVLFFIVLFNVSVKNIVTIPTKTNKVVWV